MTTKRVLLIEEGDFILRGKATRWITVEAPTKMTEDEIVGSVRKIMDEKDLSIEAEWEDTDDLGLDLDPEKVESDKVCFSTDDADLQGEPDIRITG